MSSHVAAHPEAILRPILFNAAAVAEAVIAGRISLRRGDEAIAELEAMGALDAADTVRCAVAARRELLRRRGFSALGSTP